MTYKRGFCVGAAYESAALPTELHHHKHDVVVPSVPTGRQVVKGVVGSWSETRLRDPTVGKREGAERLR